MWLTVVMMQIKTIKEKAEEEKKKEKGRKIFENQNRLQNSKEIRTTKDQQDFLDTEAEPLVITANFKTHFSCLPVLPVPPFSFCCTLCFPVSISPSLVAVSLPYLYLTGL